VFLPQAGAALGILVPRTFLARETEDENVGPAVVINVVREGKEILRITVRIVTVRDRFRAVVALLFEALLQFVICVLIGEVRTFPPVFS